MSRGSIALLTGLTLMVLCAVESYVSTMDSYYQGMLERLAQPFEVPAAVLECHLLPVDESSETDARSDVEALATDADEIDALDGCRDASSLTGTTQVP